MTTHVIDVRSKLEYKMGHVKEAIHIPLQSIKDDTKLNDIAKSDEVIVYCASGGRSSMAVQALKKKGYTRVTNGVNKSQTERLLEQ